MPEWAWYLLLIPAGFLAGVVNTIAGGGSFLTLPALLLLGDWVPGSQLADAKVVNGTNRVALLLSTGAATATFARHGHLDGRLTGRLLLRTVPGVPVGALLAIYLPPEAFKTLFGVIFLGMAVLLMVRPGLLLGGGREPIRSPAAQWGLFLGIGVYVGFIQAGMGLWVLLGLSLFHGRDLVGANGVKNAMGLALTTVALAVFTACGQVAWVPGLIMAVGNLAGGYVGAKLAIRKGQKLVFAFLIVVMVATGVKLLA